jgi:hypothetical protein
MVCVFGLHLPVRRNSCLRGDETQNGMGGMSVFSESNLEAKLLEEAADTFLSRDTNHQNSHLANSAPQRSIRPPGCAFSINPGSCRSALAMVRLAQATYGEQ